MQMGMDDLRALQKEINALEKKTGGSGAVPNTPKQQMLDASDVEKANPEKRLRWINLRDPNKVASRKSEGYVRLSSEEGGRAIGDEMALFAIPRSRYEGKLASIAAENKRRLTVHEVEVASVIEGVARIMRDKYGIKIDEKRLLINEG